MPQDSEGLRRFLQGETWAESGGGPPSRSFLVPGLTLLYHSDPRRVGERAPLPGLTSGPEEPLSRLEPSFSQPGSSVLRPLGDPYLSRRPLHLSPGTVPGAVILRRGESGTAVAAGGVPIADERERLSPEEVAAGVVLLLANHVVLLLSLLDPMTVPGVPGFGLVGESASMIGLREEIRRVAPLDVAVLLRGETGTGKELAARALHEAGSRKDGPFLAVNMAAIPATLAAAELFGAARGAFTGADRRRAGLFQRAHGGTLFLDEIGEMPAEIQALLLRALETGEIQPVGGEEPVKVDVRLVAATDADLQGAVEAGRFRAPLLHRLAGYEIRIPPLRSRREDFGRLFLHFVRIELETLGETARLAHPPEERPWIPASLVARLAAFDWPGNVRQLRNAVRQIIIAGRDAGEPGMWLQAERLLQEASRRQDSDETGVPLLAPAPPPARALRKTYRPAEAVTEEELAEALRTHGWRIQRTAAALGISRTALYERIEKSPNLRKAADLTREDIEACRSRCGGDLDAMVAILEVSRRGLQRRMAQLGLG